MKEERKQALEKYYNEYIKPRMLEIIKNKHEESYKIHELVSLSRTAQAFKTYTFHKNTFKEFF